MPAAKPRLPKLQPDQEGAACSSTTRILKLAVIDDIIHCYTLLSGTTHSTAAERNPPYSKYSYADFMTTIVSRSGYVHSPGAKTPFPSAIILQVPHQDAEWM